MYLPESGSVMQSGGNVDDVGVGRLLELLECGTADVEGPNRVDLHHRSKPVRAELLGCYLPIT
jgi:hypothetical protein